MDAPALPSAEKSFFPPTLYGKSWNGMEMFCIIGARNIEDPSRRELFDRKAIMAAGFLLRRKGTARF
jgi:hypothetical protein